jgi:hypothetical protein
MRPKELIGALGGLPHAEQRRMIDPHKPAIWRIPGKGMVIVTAAKKETLL